jgi:hypothetical protein
LLFKSGSTDRLGKVADGNTVCDFDPEAVKTRCFGFERRGAGHLGQHQDQCD